MSSVHSTLVSFNTNTHSFGRTAAYDVKASVNTAVDRRVAVKALNTSARELSASLASLKARVSK